MKCQAFGADPGSNSEVNAKIGGKSCVYFRKMTKKLMRFVAFNSEQIVTSDRAFMPRKLLTMRRECGMLVARQLMPQAWAAAAARIPHPQRLVVKRPWNKCDLARVKFDLLKGRCVYF